MLEVNSFCMATNTFGGYS